jgi:hypothetical protein
LPGTHAPLDTVHPSWKQLKEHHVTILVNSKLRALKYSLSSSTLRIYGPQLYFIRLCYSYLRSSTVVLLNYELYFTFLRNLLTLLIMWISLSSIIARSLYFRSS